MTTGKSWIKMGEDRHLELRKECDPFGIFEKQVAQALAEHLSLSMEEIKPLLEKPKNIEHGDLAIHCGKLDALIRKKLINEVGN